MKGAWHRLILTAVLLATTLSIGASADQFWKRILRPVPPAAPPVTAEPATPENFSPLGFDDLLAYERAYPAEVGSARFAAANAQKYWAW